MIYPKDLEIKLKEYLEGSDLDCSFKPYGSQFSNLQNIKEDAINLGVKRNCLIHFINIDTLGIDSDHAQDVISCDLLVCARNLRSMQDQKNECLTLTSDIRKFVYQTRFKFDNTNEAIVEPREITPILSHKEVAVFKITLKIHIYENLQYS